MADTDRELKTKTLRETNQKQMAATRTVVCSHKGRKIIKENGKCRTVKKKK